MPREAIDYPPHRDPGPEGVVDRLVALKNLPMDLALIVVPNLAADGAQKLTSAKSGRVRSISNQSSVTATTRLTPISDDSILGVALKPCLSGVEGTV